MREKVYEFSNGVRILNCTKHALNFLDNGQTIIVEPSGFVIDAKINEQNNGYLSEYFGTEIFNTKFLGDFEVSNKIDHLSREFSLVGKKEVLFVGSQIAAQAYPERVAALVSVAGYERAEWSKKLMRCDKFIMF